MLTHATDLVEHTLTHMPGREHRPTDGQTDRLTDLWMCVCVKFRQQLSRLKPGPSHHHQLQSQVAVAPAGNVKGTVCCRPLVLATDSLYCYDYDLTGACVTHSSHWLTSKGKTSCTDDESASYVLNKSDRASLSDHL